VETLGEIDHEGREEALRLGIKHFEMSSGLNDSPKFVFALGQLVLEALGKQFIPAFLFTGPQGRLRQRRWWRLTKKPGLG